MTAFSQRVVAAGSAAVLGAAVLTVASATPAQAAVALTCPATVPVYAIDGCADGCARAWLERRGVPPQTAYIHEGMCITQPGV